MNKILSTFLIGLVLLGLGGCSNDSRNRAYTLSQISHPTDADSLMYYFGQLRAVKFWRDAANDSTLREPGAREEYLDGLKDAMKSLDRSEAYLLGLIDGANHAENILRYSQNYDRKFNPDVMLKSMLSALAADSVENLSEVRRQFYGIRNRMENDRDQRDESRANAALVEAAKELGMTQVNNDLWKKTLVQGSGKKIERGDRIEVAMQMVTEDGHKIPIRLPSQVVVGGRMMSTLFPDALMTMQMGDRCQFATTALAIFGTHTAQMDLHPESILLLTISVLGEASDNDPSINGEEIPGAVS